MQYIFIKNAFENVVCKMTSISSRPQVQVQVQVQNGLFNQKSSLGVQTTNQQEKNNLKIYQYHSTIHNKV